MRLRETVGTAMLGVACGGAPAATPNEPVPETATAEPGKPAPVEKKDVAASLPVPGPNAIKGEGGLITEVLKVGVGARSPSKGDVAVTHYEGWTRDGNKFESTVGRKPVALTVGTLMPGMDQSIRLMVVGEKRRVWVPAELAYGDAPTRKGAPAGDLLFEFEVREIRRAPTPPSSIEKPTGDAKCLKSGVCISTMVPARPRAKRPSKSDRVWVHYSGWRKDGVLFDSSLSRGLAGSFAVDAVIPGWMEALPELAEGGSYVIWVPSALAWGDPPTRKGAPAGDLVFKMDLLRVEPTGLSDQGTTSDVSPERLRESIEGRWGWTQTNKVDSTCGGKPQTHSFSESGKVLTLAASSTDPSPAVYDVISVSSGAARVALRPDEEGEKSEVWDMVFRSPVEYCWRRSDWEENACTASVVRCALGEAQ